MKVLFTGGGTAGHVNPALAMAAALQAYDPNTEILFVSSAIPTDKANDLIPRKGYDLKKVRIRGMARPVFMPSNITLPFIMLRSRGEAKKIIKDFAPDLIVGTGGYACWPVVSMGASMGIPTAVHESNALPGKAILQVKKKVDKVLLNFPETEKKMGLKPNDPRVVRVGNPYMADFKTITDTARICAYLYNEDGSFDRRESYNELILEYVTVANEDGVVPLNEQLAYVVKTAGDYMGWWNFSDGLDIFDGKPVDPAVAWLFACAVYQ